MGEKYSALKPAHINFIENQKMFFVATAPQQGRINLSPKGLDTLRIINENRILWLNLTGSGNETAAHLAEDPRITIMFNAFEGNPLILRLYGTARSIHDDDQEWNHLITNFPDLPGKRQIIDVKIETVQTSCGFGVPLYEYKGQRNELIRWAEKKGDDGLIKYRKEKNMISMDGKSIRNNSSRSNNGY
ncbi:MAG: pyridoxamine 5'-phosphate oxidase family protein [Spirochaetia bacterium]|nr:pyridoxamine 5'-phosphate oxidase family protein [Spirochaetia bacterium]